MFWKTKMTRFTLKQIICHWVVFTYLFINPFMMDGWICAHKSSHKREFKLNLSNICTLFRESDKKKVRLNRLHQQITSSKLRYHKKKEWENNIRREGDKRERVREKERESLGVTGWPTFFAFYDLIKASAVLQNRDKLHYFIWIDFLRTPSKSWMKRQVRFHLHALVI